MPAKLTMERLLRDKDALAILWLFSDGRTKKLRYKNILDLLVGKKRQIKSERQLERRLSELTNVGLLRKVAVGRKEVYYQPTNKAIPQILKARDLYLIYKHRAKTITALPYVSPFMTLYGINWKDYTEEEQKQLRESFREMSVAFFNAMCIAEPEVTVVLHDIVPRGKRSLREKYPLKEYRGALDYAEKRLRTDIDWIEHIQEDRDFVVAERYAEIKQHIEEVEELLTERGLGDIFKEEKLKRKLESIKKQLTYEHLLEKKKYQGLLRRLKNLDKMILTEVKRRKL